MMIGEAMQITMRQLVDGWQALQKLGTVQAGQGLTLKQAYWIGKLATAPGMGPIRTAQVVVSRVAESRTSLVI